MNWTAASEKVDRLLRAFTDTCAMELTYELRVRDGGGLAVTFAGADASRLTARNGELLHALEIVAADALRLGAEEQELISFDAEDFKERRVERLRRAAEVGVESVRSTGRPYAFAPMNSLERRMLHLELVRSGLRTASSGEASRRFVVLYPGEQGSGNKGSDERLKVIRNAFRPR